MRRFLPLLCLLAGVTQAAPAAADPVDLVCRTADALGCETYYRDADGDGYGDDASAHRAPIPPEGETTTGGDCDDADATVHPGAVESYDGADEDCDGAADEVVLVLSELMVNPKATADTTGEWMEVTNASAEPADLAGVAIHLGSRVCELSGTLAKGSRYVVARSEGAGVPASSVCVFSLTNTGARVQLSAPTGGLDSVDYTGWPVPDGASFSLDPSGHHPLLNDAPGAWCPGVTPYGTGDLGTPGSPNDDCA